MSEETKIVIDIGDEKPRFIFPSVVGKKFDEKGDPLPDSPTYVGTECFTSKEKITWKYPFTRGIVVDWEDYESLLRHVFKLLKIHPKNSRVLLTVPSFITEKAIKNLMQVFFKNLGVQALCFVDDNHLALLGQGETTGITLGIGADVSCSSAYYEGFNVEKSAYRMNIGGNDVSQLLAGFLSKKADIWKYSPAVLDKIKHDCCFVSLPETDHDLRKKKKVVHKLPDGKKLTLGPSRWRATEILLKNESTMTIPEMLVNSIRKYLRQIFDKRVKIFDKIFIFGGTAFFAGLSERLEGELLKVFTKEKKMNITLLSEHASYVGGAKLMNNENFEYSFLSREEYNTYGANQFVNGFFNIRGSVMCSEPIKTFNLSNVEKKFWRNENAIQNLGQISKNFEEKITKITGEAKQMEDGYLSHIDKIEHDYGKRIQEATEMNLSLEDNIKKYSELLKHESLENKFHKKKWDETSKEYEYHRQITSYKHTQMQQVIQSITIRNDNVRKENNRLKKELESFKKELKGNNKVVHHLHAKSKKMELDFTKRAKELEISTQSKIIVLRKEFEAKMSKKQEKIEQLGKRVRKKKRQGKAELKSLKESKNSKVSKTFLERSVQKMKTQISKLKKENESLKKKLKNTESTMEEREKMTTEKMQKRIDSLMKKNRRLSRQVSDTKGK